MTVLIGVEKIKSELYCTWFEMKSMRRLLSEIQGQALQDPESNEHLMVPYPDGLRRVLNQHGLIHTGHHLATCPAFFFDASFWPSCQIPAQSFMPRFDSFAGRPFDSHSSSSLQVESVRKARGDSEASLPLDPLRG